MKKIIGLTTVLALLAPVEARADFHIRSPYEIDLGELEIEHNGAALFDRNARQKRCTELHDRIRHRPDQLVAQRD